MNKSKFLKKSLAALLAILMVAAMIPMSAFAADEPDDAAPAPLPDYLITVDGVRASGSSADGYTATVERTVGSLDAIQLSWAEVSGTSIAVKELGTGNMLGSGNTDVALDKGVKGDDMDAYGGGTYTYTLVVTVGSADPVEVKLAVKVNVSQKSTDATIKEVKNVTGMVGTPVISGDTITIKMNLSVNVDSPSPGIKSGDLSDGIADANLFLTGSDAGKVKATATGNAEVTDAAKKLAVYKQVFVPNSANVQKMTLTDGQLEVTSQQGSTKVYTVKFENEASFNSFTLGETAGTIKSPKEIEVTLPYSYLDKQPANTDNGITAEAATKAATKDKVADAKVSWTIDKNGLVQYGNGTWSATASDNKTSGVLQLDDLADGTDTSDYYVFETKTATSGILMVKKYGSTEGTVKVTIKVPKKNPDAKLTHIKIDDGQVYPIADHTATQGIVPVKVELPRGQVATGNHTITLYGPDGATIAKAMNATGTEFSSGINYVSAAINFTGPVLVNVTSEDGSTVIQYEISLSVNSSPSTALNDLKLVNDDGEQIGTVAHTGNNYTITVPFSTAGVKDLKVVATASTSSFISYNADATTFGASEDGRVNSGITTVSNLFGGTPDFDTPGNTTAVIRVWNNGTSATDADATKTDYPVTIARGDANRNAVIESAVITSAVNKADVDDVNSYKATVSSRTSPKTVEVTLPFSESFAKKQSGGSHTIYFDELKVSPGAKVLVEPAAIAKNQTATLVPFTFTSEASNSGAAITLSNANWETTPAASHAPIRLWVFSEEKWDEVGGDTYDAEPADPDDKVTDGTKHYYSDLVAGTDYEVYELSATVTPAQTGNELINISAPLDENVTVAKDDTSKTITITAPYSYSTNADKTFTLNIETSPLAKVFMDTTTNIDATITAGTALILSDKGTEEGAETATAFNANGGELNTSAAITASKAGILAVIPENGKGANKWNVVLNIADAEKDATVKGITVAGKAAVQDEEDATAWTVTLPNGTLLEQVLAIDTSKLATVFVNGAVYDPEKTYTLSETAAIAIRVVAEDGTTEENYTLKAVLAPASTEAAITAATVNGEDAVIDEENKTITAVIPDAEADLSAAKVTLTASENAKVTVDGEDYTEGEVTVDLSENNTVEVVVTAEDGTTTATYTLSATARTLSTEAKIVSLKVNDVEATANDEGDFTAELEADADLTKVVLTIEVSENAKATIDGEEYTGAELDFEAAEANTIQIEVVAEDGETTEPYNVTVTKKAALTVDNFTDVDEKDWFAEKVAKVYELGLMKGQSVGADSKITFNPQGNITRQEFATILCTLHGITDPGTADVSELENPFTDNTGWGKNAVMIANSYGWMSGYEDGTFRPNGNITREEAMTALNNALKMAPVSEYVPFADDARIASWAKDHVYAARAKGYISGKDNNMFAPKDLMTRAEAASILLNVYPDVTPIIPGGDDEPTPSPNPDEGDEPTPTPDPDEGDEPTPTPNPDEGDEPTPTPNPDEGDEPTPTPDPDEGDEPTPAPNPDEGDEPAPTPTPDVE